MTVLSAQTIRELSTTIVPAHRSLIQPFSECKQALGMSYGLSACGYDIRIGSFNIEGQQTRRLYPGDFILASSLERFVLPNWLCAELKDKSTLARRGVAVQNTILEPGWEGYLTIEISNHGTEKVRLRRGQPIGQLVFQKLDEPTEQPYRGKYQNQEDRPVEARHSLAASVGDTPASTLIEAEARRIAAKKMGLVKDPDGKNLPDELWQQCQQEAFEYLYNNSITTNKDED